MMNVTLIDSRMVEFLYDKEDTRYMVFLLVEKESDSGTTEREWVLMKKAIPAGKHQKEAILLLESEIYPVAVRYCSDFLFTHPFVNRVLKTSKYSNFSMNGENIQPVKDVTTTLEAVSFILKASYNAEPYDHYARIEGGLMIDYTNSKGKDSSIRINSSTIMEKYLDKLGKKGSIQNIRFSTTYPNSFQLNKMGRFVIPVPSYYMIKNEEGYLLGDDGKSVYTTTEKCRALKFISEDEALEYATMHMKTFTSFDLELVVDRTKIERCLPTKKDDFWRFTGTLAETFPFPSNL